MKTRSQLAAFGMPFLEWPAPVAYLVLVLIGQLIVSLPLSFSVMAARVPASSVPWTYVGIILFGLGVSAIIIIQVRKIRLKFEREMERMAAEELARAMNEPDNLTFILGSYKGGYSLGVIRDPGRKKKLALRLNIEGDDRMDIPSHIQYAGEEIPILVRTGWVRPVPVAG